MRGVAVNTAPLELLDATLRLLKLLDRPEDIPMMAPLIEQEILYRLPIGPYGPKLLRIAATDSPSNASENFQATQNLIASIRRTLSAAVPN